MQHWVIESRVIRVCKIQNPERAAREDEAVLARDPHFAGVEDAHPKQLAVIRVRERQVVRHGRDRRSVGGDSGADQGDQQAH